MRKFPGGTTHVHRFSLQLFSDNSGHMRAATEGLTAASGRGEAIGGSSGGATTGCCVLWRTYVLTASEQRWVSAPAGRECGASCHWQPAFRWCFVSYRVQPSSRTSLGSLGASESSYRGGRGGCVRRSSGMQSSKSGIAVSLMAF